VERKSIKGELIYCFYWTYILRTTKKYKKSLLFIAKAGMQEL
jgi:hypothetical protein